MLLAYPFLVEPRLTLGEQSVLWGYGYTAFALLSAACGVVLAGRARRGFAPARPDGDATRWAPPISWLRRVRWTVLAAVPAALSLATTQHITTDIAAVPLLWIAPLALYLASFVVAFSRHNPLTSGRSALILPLPVAVAVAVPFIDPPIVVSIAAGLALLFFACVMCHTLLADDRPPTARLTEYYLFLSVGGAAGGAFVSLIAPLVFERIWEYPLAVAAVAVLRPPARRPKRRALISLVTIALVGSLMMAVPTLMIGAPTWATWAGLAAILVAISPWRVAFALGVSLVLAAAAFGGSGVHTERTFFGVYRVTEAEGRHHLIHGTTVHGMQHRAPGLRGVATMYYHRTGPIGQVFQARGNEAQRVGVVGLGVGTLATYGVPQQAFTFFEIDPAIVGIARDPELFTYLADSRADVQVIVADGRLGLAAPQAPYDVLVLDAFSSDAIPVHLLTSEAVAIYADKLSPGGLMAFHITNRHLELEPVLGTIARDLRMTALSQSDSSLTPEDIVEGKAPSEWVLIARSRDDLEPFASDARWREAAIDIDGRPWSDDFADILGTLR